MAQRKPARNSGPRPASAGGAKRSPRAGAPGYQTGLKGGLRIVHEDDDVLVVDKPSGLLTATMIGQLGENAFTFVKDYVKDRSRKRGTRVWILHRLDKEASGLIVFAKSERAFEWIKSEFRSKRMHRLYCAVLEGELKREPGAKQLPVGTVQSFLIEDENGVMRSVQSPTAARTHPAHRRGGDSDGDDGEVARLAVTHYRALEIAHGRTMVQVRLETGRKNQIRVHMRDLRHPIAGDRRYGAETDPIGRVCLHAMELGFTHPTTGETVRFRSPPPREFYMIVGKNAQGAEEAADRDEVADFAPASAKPAASAVPAQAKAAQVTPQGSESIASSWDHVAGWYTNLVGERLSDHHERVILPGTLRLLGVAPGVRVLDLACGEGILARRIASLGGQVVGVDASPRLIEAAQRAGLGVAVGKQAGHAGGRVEYHVGDARQVGAMPVGSFDAAACVMAIMNIEPMSPVLAGIASHLRPGGRFVAVMLHPAFRSPGQTGWGWDTSQEGDEDHRGDTGRGDPRRGGGPQSRSASRKGAPARGGPKPSNAKQYRRVDGYLSPGVTEIVMNPGAASSGAAKVTTLTYHRPLQTYVRAFAEAGLLIDAMEEWPSMRQSEPGPRAAEENRARKEIPMFLALRGVRGV